MIVTIRPKPHLVRRLFLIAFGLLIFQTGYAQVDTEFWFAPPEVTVGHGDRPLYLRISTLDQAAVVTVFQPGRNNATIGTANVPANTTHTMDLSSHIANLETISPATVMKTGLRIVSSAPVTVYYEVRAPFNADIFVLKGRNALGNKFVIPAQNFYHNSGEYVPTPSSSFDIVATSNNTVVTVRPTKPIFGHAGDSVITVKLNAGETYSFRKSGLLASDNPGGTRVESNKPIAITIKDDSVINGGCRDILGDQLVPVEVAGTEYVVLKGFLHTQEFVFITATEHETEIFIGGSGTPVAVLQAGEIYRHPVFDNSTYILSNKTIYVFHVTGFGCEMGLAILPSINCKGSPQVGFSRTTSEFFGLNLLVPREGIHTFTLNGSSSLVPASAFSPVAGTNDRWYAAQFSFNEAQIQVNQPSTISNSQNSFQLGIINGNAASTCRYGYFSSFSTLFIGDDLAICEGETAILNAGPGKESYLWSTGETSQSIGVGAGGEYWVKVQREDCVLYDTIRVAVKKGQLDLGPDIQVCRGETAIVDGKDNFSWKWSDGSTAQFLHTTKEGKYWLSVSDYTGCQASDTIVVTLVDPPSLDLGEDVIKCREDAIFIDATYPGAAYRWQDGLTAPSRNITEEGLYYLQMTAANGCSAVDSLLVKNLPGPQQDSIWGSPSVCPFATGIAYAVDASPSSDYQWFVEGGTIASSQQNHITVDWLDTNPTAMVKALITDSSGCRSDTLYYPVRINVVLLAERPLGPDTLCWNNSTQVVYNTPLTNGSVYQWNILGGEITSGQGSAEVTINWTKGLNRLWIEETSITADTVCHGTSPELSVYVFQDTTAIDLRYVSVDTAAANLIHIGWNTRNGEALGSNYIYLHGRTQGYINWDLVATVDRHTQSYSDGVDLAAEGIREYHLTLTNFCNELLSTAIHNNIFLTGIADSTTELITLSWNHYYGWPGGVDRYEVWRKTDFEPGYRLLTAIPPYENSFRANLATDAFHHDYVIRAIEKSGEAESWSTNLSFDFSHPVTIPNVITPNGDAFNQYFHITKITLYRESELTILDRWGKEVFHAVNYQNDWDGGGVSAGVYFYILDLKRDNKVYKGALSILKSKS